MFVDFQSLSPCVAVCRLSADGVCQGCFRHTDELGNWGLLSLDQRRTILALCQERQASACAEPAPETAP